MSFKTIVVILNVMLVTTPSFASSCSEDTEANAKYKNNKYIELVSAEMGQVTDAPESLHIEVWAPHKIEARNFRSLTLMKGVNIDIEGFSLESNGGLFIPLETHRLNSTNYSSFFVHRSILNDLYILILYYERNNELDCGLVLQYKLSDLL